MNVDTLSILIQNSLKYVLLKKTRHKKACKISCHSVKT